MIPCLHESCYLPGALKHRAPTTAPRAARLLARRASVNHQTIAAKYLNFMRSGKCKALTVADAL
jgi:hypothetical protein